MPVANIGEGSEAQAPRHTARKGSVVFVLDKRKRPLMPCSEKRARLLLHRRKAVIHRRFPFTIRLKERAGGDVQAVHVKLDPGSVKTGVAVVRVEGGATHVIHLSEIEHRGKVIRKKMEQRSAYRRRRRSANLRYREKRFDNRRRPDGWLAPSIQSRVDNVTSWVRKYQRLAPVVSVSQELVRFDMQKMERPEISGVEYQQGALAGYEAREYLLEKWGRKCAYCGAKNLPLQIEHIHPKARGGSNRISNLTLACGPCNQKKGAQPVEDFLRHKPDALKRILAQSKKPLADAAAVNAARWNLFNTLKRMGLDVSVGSGGRTKWNRTRLDIPKAHALDAACVGKVGSVTDWNRPKLEVKASGRGTYQRTRTDAYGFARLLLGKTKVVAGFQTGDMVRAVVPTGKKAGIHVGRVAVRLSRSFDISTGEKTVQGINAKWCKRIAPADGYGYAIERAPFLPPPKGGGLSGLVR